MSALSRVGTEASLKIPQFPIDWDYFNRWLMALRERYQAGDRTLVAADAAAARSFEVRVTLKQLAFTRYILTGLFSNTQLSGARSYPHHQRFPIFMLPF